MIQRRFALLIALLFSSNVARGEPPFLTDDPWVPPLHSWEINIPYTLTVTPINSTMQIPLLDINYVLFPDLVVIVDPQVVRFKRSGGNPQVGIGDTTVGVLWRFLGGLSEFDYQIATEPFIVIPTGDNERGLGLGRPAFQLQLLGQIGREPFKTYGLGGYNVQLGAGQRNYWNFAWVILYYPSEKGLIGLEILGNSPQTVGGKPLIGFDVGTKFNINKNLSLLVSGGRSFLKGRSINLYTGLQFNLNVP